MAKQALELVNKLLLSFEREFDEDLLKPEHLRPYTYRVTLTSRPFGIALCKLVAQKYLCVVVPESPSGQLGLRSGSEILAINAFAETSGNIKDLNKYFEDKKDCFIWMSNFPKIEYLSSNDSMPITLFLRYDPMKILSETKDKYNTMNNNNNNNDETCEFWKQVQDDLYRWAIEGKYEIWQVICKDNIDVYSIPPILSPIINKNVQITAEKAKQENNEDGKSAHIFECVTYDKYYKKVGELKFGDKLYVYGKSGAYINVKKPINGWAKILDTKGNKFIKKIDDIKSTDNDSKENDINDNLRFENFKINILSQYLSAIGITDHDTSKNDSEYDIFNLIEKLNTLYQTKKPIIIYFMGDIEFGNTLDRQQSHLKKIKQLNSKYTHDGIFIVVKVLCLETEISSDASIKPILIGNNVLNISKKGDILLCRAKMDILKKLNLFQYDMGFFKYGLLVLNFHSNNDYVISLHPKMSLDDIKYKHFDMIEVLLKKSAQANISD